MADEILLKESLFPYIFASLLGITSYLLDEVSGTYGLNDLRKNIRTIIPDEVAEYFAPKVPPRPLTHRINFNIQRVPFPHNVIKNAEGNIVGVRPASAPEERRVLDGPPPPDPDMTFGNANPDPIEIKEVADFLNRLLRDMFARQSDLRPAGVPIRSITMRYIKDEDLESGRAVFRSRNDKIELTITLLPERVMSIPEDPEKIILYIKNGGELELDNASPQRIKDTWTPTNLAKITNSTPQLKEYYDFLRRRHSNNEPFSAWTPQPPTNWSNIRVVKNNNNNNASRVNYRAEIEQKKKEWGMGPGYLPSGPDPTPIRVPTASVARPGQLDKFISTEEVEGFKNNNGNNHPPRPPRPGLKWVMMPRGAAFPPLWREVSEEEQYASATRRGGKRRKTHKKAKKHRSSSRKN
jgi:hypothetical protein